MPVIDDQIAAFINEGVSMVVATRDAERVPFATRACGVHVLGGDRLAVLLPHATSARAIANVKDNGEISLCVSSPVDFRTYQLKGRFVSVAEGTRDDVLMAEQQLRVFAGNISRFGNTYAQARALWLFDSWRVEMQVSTAFLQTPGPGAGARLERRDG
jgi:hypothetical protein